MNRSVRYAVALAAFSWMNLAGCAQSVGDIDLTQADRIDVSLLNDGKPWWFGQTVIDVPPQSGMTFIGDAENGQVNGLGGIERVVWDIQENWIVAYRNYEFIAGSQIPYSSLLTDTVSGNGTAASRTPYFGSPVVAYPILSHFDVTRQYNPQTGEQTNVITEDTTSRPWYERQYIRVDWGNNAFGGLNFLYMSGSADQLNTLVSPLSFYIDQAADPTNPDRSEIGSNYIGLVNKLSYKGVVNPMYSQYFGSTIYDCQVSDMGWIGITDCGPTEIKIRLSFRKIEPTHDFVPRAFSDTDELMFGVWQQQRTQYDPQRGIVEPLLSQNQFAMMHHIWQTDHLAKDSVTGAPCDTTTWDNPNCIAPLNQRTPKPIVYYVNSNWPSINDPSHYSMWTNEALIADDLDFDMRGVVAGALRGGPNSVEKTMPGYVAPANTAGIDYSKPETSYSRYTGATGLDYLAYPPHINPSAQGGTGPNGEDLSNDAQLGMRPAGTWIMDADNDTLCTASQIMQSQQNQLAGQGGPCHICDPTQGYCMGIQHVPYAKATTLDETGTPGIPRMVVFCHNPVQPRVIGSWINPLTGQTVSIDKSDSTKPASFNFATPGDPDICDPRPDADRTAKPLSPQMGDIRYNMHAYVPQPDGTSPGGIGEPAADPVTGEIISAHAYVYGRPVENWATLGADMVSVLNGWQTFTDLIDGNIVNDYITTLQTTPNVIFKPSALKGALMSPNGLKKIATIRQMVGANPDGTISGALGHTDYGLANWLALGGNSGGGPLALFDPRPNEMMNDFGLVHGMAVSGQSPPGALAATSMGNFVAPSTVSTFNSSYERSRHIAIEAHLLLDEDIEPTAMRLAKYYKDKYAAKDPCLNTNGITDTSTAQYRTCIWEQARKDILGNEWRAYSAHEVGHTFGMYHNFAASTDALNYYDTYWALRQENVVKNLGSCAAGDAVCAEMTKALGTVPSGTALAPEWVQAPTYDSLQKGLREYQYTSIMDYNSLTFNSDFQGYGKYDHACHMYQYGNQVEVFDPAVLPNVPVNEAPALHPHQISDQILQPFNRHYTIYPWIIADGTTNGPLSGASTPLPVAIQKMIHGRKWVRYDDLFGATTDLPNGLQDSDVQARDGFPSLAALTANSTTMVPYRFCSDAWEGGTSWCYAFDQGADVFEQANTFITDYKFFYFFSNFKRDSVNYILGGDGAELFGPYYSKLWNRNFGKQAQIGQHYLNDELIIRGSDPCTQDPAFASNPLNTVHWGSMPCGLDRTAAVVSIVDFMTKLMQTPNPEPLGYVPSSNLLCGTTLSCSQDGYTGGNGPNATDPISLQNITLLPGASAKNDISQYSIQQYGMQFGVKPTIAGVWVDKLLAAQALGDYNTHFVGELNNQPLSYLESISSLFQNDIVRAMGSAILNDPRYWPILAVSTGAGGPNDPTAPPVILYRNSAALQNVGTNGIFGNFPFAINSWCPAGDPNCSVQGPPGPPPPPVGSVGFRPTYEQPPVGYGLVVHNPPVGTIPPVGPIKDAMGNTVYPTPVDSSPVYYEKLFMLSIGAVYFTQPQVGNFQNFIEGIKITEKGNQFGATSPSPLKCNGSAATVIKPANYTCGDGTTVCSPSTGPGTGTACQDGSACALREWNCPSSSGPYPNEEAARTAGALTGVCYYGGVDNSQGQTFGYANCDPDFYSEYNDTLKGTTHYAVRFVPSQGDLTDIGNVDPYLSYSPGYEVLKMANAQSANATAAGIGANTLIPIFQSYYYYWVNVFSGGAPFGDGISQY